MESSEIPATDSGYPTPREDFPLSSRSDSSPPSPRIAPLTSTPLRGRYAHPIRDPLGPRSNSLADELSTIDEAETSGVVMQGVRTMLKLAKDAKATSRVNNVLRQENYTLRDENESLRDENTSLREESRRIELQNASLRFEHEENLPPPIIPKLNLNGEEQKLLKLENLILSEDVKKELLSFIKNEEDRSVFENKLEHMVLPKVFSATVQVNTDKMNADVQTDADDQVNVINSDWQIKVDQLHSQLEVTEKKKTDLEDRLFDFEQLKSKFEENQEKLRSDLEKKLKSSQEKVSRHEKKIEELEHRLSKKRKEHEEVSAENRRLIEDRETHEFETDELKIRIEDLENKLKKAEETEEELKKEIGLLEEKLEEEKEAKLAMEKDLEKRKKEFAKDVDRLTKEAEEAVAKEGEALDQLKEVQSEMRKVVKENEYLSAAQQALLDSEMNLKTEGTVMTATLRNFEQQLQLVQKELADEKRRKKEADAEILELGLTNKQLEDDKRDADELLRELKEGKLEIEYLRQQMHHASQESEEMRALREQFQQNQQRTQELEEKLASAEKKEQELIAKHEGNIHSNAAKDVELERLKQESSAQKEQISTLAENKVQSLKMIEELQRTVENLDHEFTEFRTHANLQYHDEIGERDQQIAHLHQRLVELETYPGQTISVSKRNAEIQTDEPVVIVSPVVDDVSPEVTLVSEDHHALERNIKTIIENMEHCIHGRNIANVPTNFQDDPGTEYHCSETFRQFVEILHNLLDGPDAPVEKTDNFWVDINKRAELQEQLFAEKMRTAKSLANEQLDRNEEEWKRRMRKLKDELQEVQKISEQRLYLADEFRAQYELEFKEKEEQRAEFETLSRVREQDRVEWEESNKELRERLEKAQHSIQQSARDRLERADAHDETMGELRTGFLKMEKELNFRLKMAEDELASEKSRRDYDKKTMSKMRKDFDVVVDKCAYLKNRNSERQKMLNDMRSVLIKCQQSTNPDQTMVYVEKMRDKLNRSNLLGSNDPYDSSTSDSSGQKAQSASRQALSRRNVQN